VSSAVPAVAPHGAGFSCGGAAAAPPPSPPRRCSPRAAGV